MATLNMIKKAPNSKAFSLIEVIVATALFAIFSGALLVATLGVGFSIKNSEDRLAARYYEQEAQEALRSIRDYDWDNLTAGTYGLSSASGYWELSGSSDTFEKFTRSVEITELSQTRKEAVISISWITDEGQAISTNSTLRLTNWESTTFVLDTQSDFDEGFYNSTESRVDGSVIMKQLGSWASGVSSLSEDVSGNEDPLAMRIIDNHLYLGTNNKASSGEFFIYDISDVSEGVLTELRNVELSSDVNDFVIDGDYAYLALNNTGAELAIVRLSDGTLVNLYDLPSNSVARGIALSGSEVLISTDADAVEELYAIDVSSPEGTLTQTQALEIGDNVYRLAVDGDHAFLLTDDNNEELQVLEISSFTLVDTLDLAGNADAIAVDVLPDSDRLYVGRVQSGDPEFYEIDISSPSSLGSADILGSTELNDDVLWIDAEEDASQAYLAVMDKSQAITIIDLSGHTIEAELALTGNDDAHTVAFQGVHIFAATPDNSNELQVLTGSASTAWGSASIIETANPSGNEDALSIAIGSSGNYVYLGRSSGGNCNTSGNGCEFLIYDVTDPENVVLADGLEIGDDVNDIYIDGNENYAYLATDGTELVVVDIQNKSNISTVGAGYDADSNSNGESITGDGNYVYLGTRANSGNCTLLGTNCELYIINIAIPSLPVLVGAAEIGEHVNAMAYGDGYIYMGTINNSNELYASDVTVPSLPGAPVTTNNPGNGNVKGLYYRDSDNTLHVVTTNNNSYPDYSIYSASGTSLSFLGGIDTNDSNNGVWVFESEDFAFLVGDASAEELSIIDIADPASMSLLGHIDLSSSGTAVVSDESYLYIGNVNNSQELQVVQAGAVSTSYPTEAFYQSKVFDSGSASTSWGNLEWTSSGTGTIEVMTRSASSEAGIDEALWVGSDGTPSSTYSSSGSSVQIASGASGPQYFQVLVLFTGDGTDSPVLEDLTLSYTP